MRLLLDSQIILAFARHDVAKCGAVIDLLLKSPANEKIASVASLWEIAIKYRLGKLELALPLSTFPSFIRSLGFEILDVNERHALEDLAAQPNTRDPFDRLLLAQCQVENMRLVTTDRVLAIHPLAWRER
jgi:PIN domain nuclease of toxin-antitoxin system